MLGHEFWVFLKFLLEDKPFLSREHNFDKSGFNKAGKALGGGVFLSEDNWSHHTLGLVWY